MYKATLDKSPLAVIIINLEGEILYWSPAAEIFFGWSISEAIGSKIHDLIIPERFRDHHIASMERYATTGRRVLLGSQVRLPAKFRSGEERTIDLYLEDTSYDGKRQISAWAKDATKQIQLEHKALTNERVAFETLFDTLRQSELIVFAKDVEGRYIYVNDKAVTCEVLRDHGDSVIGKTDFDLFPKDSALVIRERDLAVLNKDKAPVMTAEDIIRTPSRTYTFYTTRSRTFSSTGVTTGVFSFSVDITEYKEALLEKSRLETQEILLREKIAIANSKQKSEFLANMSHEIRTPLNAITSLATLLLDTALDDDQKDCTLGLKAATDNLIVIINDILDISKIEAGKIQMESVNTDLFELLTGVGRIFTISGEHKGVVYSQSYNIPQTRRYIKTDSTRVKQILNNLVGNAIKFTPTGGSVTLTVKSESDKIVFNIKDTGIGIDSDKADLLFKPFSQADSSISRQFGGSGLGLSISKNLVTLLGGSINFTSTPGHGSEFVFDIPYIQGTPIKVQKPPSYDEVVHAYRDKQIMIVDDNPMNLKVAVKFIERAGYHTVACHDGIEALRVYQADPDSVCLILMDCFMPNQSGYDTTRLIRLLPSPSNKVPIIAMTANALQGEREHCLSCGMNDYITKPINRETLVERVAYWLQQEMTERSSTWRE